MKLKQLLRDIFFLIRIKNLLIIAFTQCVAYYSLIIHGHIEYYNSHFISLMIGTVLIATAGYLINDYFDVESDMVNRPEKVLIGKRFSQISVLIAYVLLNLAALITGAFTNLLVWFTFSITILALFFYSYSLKKIPLVGNLLVAALMAMTLVVLWFFQAGVDKVSFIFFVLFAFLSGLFREILKDAEDMEGDKAAGYLTFPVRFGYGLTEFLLFSILFIFIIFLIIYSWSMWLEHRWWISAYLLVTVISPAVYMLPKIFKSESITEIEKLTKLAKLIMITGTLSMLLLLI